MLKFAAKPNWQFLFVFLAAAGIVCACGAYTGFHVPGSDFWSSVLYGRAMDWGQKASLYNGFYPFGYPLLIGQSPYSYVVQIAYVINALLAGLFVASVVGLTAKRCGALAVFLAAVISVSYPLVFRYANTPGPDMGSAAFPTFAIYLLWKDALAEPPKIPSRTNFIAAGVSLGLGFLWRTHALIAALLILGMALLLRLAPSRSNRAWLFGSFAFVAGLQVFVDLVSGHYPFETAQAFNFYKMMYGINWLDTPSPAEMARFSVIRLILDEPLWIWNTILPYLTFLLSFSFPAIAGWALSPRGVLKRFFFFLAAVQLFYAFPLSFSDSPRAPLPILGLYALSLAFLCSALQQRAQTIFQNKAFNAALAAALLFVYLVPASGWISADRRFIFREREAHRVFLMIENILLQRGMNSPDEVFSNKFQFYSPNRPPYLPRQMSDWYNEWFWGFDERYPRLPNSSWEEFRAACDRQGIRFLVLSPRSGLQGEFFDKIYQNEFDPQAMGVKFIGRRAGMNVYQILPDKP